jgi:hypothetical protein
VDLLQSVLNDEQARISARGGSTEAQQATQHGRDQDGAATDGPIPGHPGAEPAQPPAGLNEAGPFPAEHVFDVYRQPAGPQPHPAVRLLERMARALPEHGTLLKVVSTTACASLANVAVRRRTGHELPPKVEIGVGAFGVAAALALLFKEKMVQGVERRAEAALRRPDLAGQSLGEIMGRLLALTGDSRDASFDWSAPGLFVDDRGNDVAADVAHVFARAIDSAGRMLAAGDVTDTLVPLAVGLATDPDLRAMLANTVSEANGQCQDLVKVSLGQLMGVQGMHEIRRPDALPIVVVGELLQHATTRAASTFVHELVGPGVEPSAELMLHAYHAVETRLAPFGLAQLGRFPAPELEDWKDVKHDEAVNQWADALTAGLTKPMADLLVIDAGAVVDVLMQHGGTDFEEIFSSRLANRIKSALEPLHLRDEQLQADKDKMPVQDYVDGCRQLMQDGQDARRTIYKRAVHDAIYREGREWEVPAQPAPA